MPVLSTALAPNANANDAGAYPILTFRPVFITQQEHTGVAELDLVLDAVDSVVKTLLNIDDPTDPSDPGDHGVLMQGTELRALRFMTIEPSALPAVPTSYSGPDLGLPGRRSQDREAGEVMRRLRPQPSRGRRRRARVRAGRSRSSSC